MPNFAYDKILFKHKLECFSSFFFVKKLFKANVKKYRKTTFLFIKKEKHKHSTYLPFYSC